MTEIKNSPENGKYSGDDELSPFLFDSSAESSRTFLKTTLETFRNKSPKLWSNDFTEFKSEIGLKVEGDFLGFFGKFWGNHEMLMKNVKCLETKTFGVIIDFS